MLKFTNICACIIAAGVFGMLAKGDMSQELLRNSMIWAYWVPCGAFTLAGAVNLLRKG